MVDPMIISLNSQELDFLDLDPPEPDFRERFLALDLALEETVLIPVESVSKVLHVQINDILPVPDIPAYVRGIFNWQGQMLWLVNIARSINVNHFNHDSLAPGQDFYTVIILRYGQNQLGIIVSQIYDIELHNPEQMKRIGAGLFHSQLIPFSAGYLPDRGVVVLDSPKIIKYFMSNGHFI